MKRKIMRAIGLFFALFVIPYKRKVSTQEIESFSTFGNYIILTKQKWCLTNLFIKGKYKHAGIINQACTHIVEATTHGVRQTNLADFLSSKHNYLVFRPYRITQRERMLIEGSMYKYIGRPYDWLFFWEDSSLYCSELVATVFNIIRPNFFNVNNRIIQPTELLDTEIEIMVCK